MTAEHVVNTAKTDIHFEINPHVGVGPILFGMSRDTVRKILGSSFEEFLKTPEAVLPTDSFDKLCLHVYYAHDKDKIVCRGVEFFPGSNLSYQGNQITGRAFNEVMQWLQKLDPLVALDEDSSVKSDKLGLDLWAPDTDEDLNSLVQSAYVFH